MRGLCRGQTMDVKSTLSIPKGRVGDNGREQVSDSIMLQVREEFCRSASRKKGLNISQENLEIKIPPKWTQCTQSWRPRRWRDPSLSHVEDDTS